MPVHIREPKDDLALEALKIVVGIFFGFTVIALIIMHPTVSLELTKTAKDYIKDVQQGIRERFY